MIRIGFFNNFANVSIAKPGRNFGYKLDFIGLAAIYNFSQFSS
jgi:hypothetical protein